MTPAMPKKSKLKLPTLEVDLSNDQIGRRIATFRRKRGLTQTELANNVGIIQALVSDYERGKLKVSAEMAARIALALGISTDRMLGIDGIEANNATPIPSRKVLRRVQRIEKLPAHQQNTLLRTIDTFLRGAEI